jgi:hypothetical protein
MHAHAELCGHAGSQLLLLLHHCCCCCITAAAAASLLLLLLLLHHCCCCCCCCRQSLAGIKQHVKNDIGGTPLPDSRFDPKPIGA